MRLRGLLAFLLTLVLGVHDALADDGRPKGANCRLSSPPARSGLFTGHTVFKVFPRAKDIGARYSGCQSVWIWTGNWQLFEMGYFDKGELRTYYVPKGVFDSEVSCTYRDGEVIAVIGEEHCMPARELPRTSLPADCLAELKGSGLLSERCGKYE